jgi:aminoglycoside phosphotransferase (APT) family kinase protein
MLAEEDPGRITAVLDWEMASVGDPLIDLGVMLCYWPQAGDPLARREAISPITTLPGWPTRAELLDRYQRETGRALDGDRLLRGLRTF